MKTIETNNTIAVLENIVSALIRGETVSITNVSDKKYIQKRLREIKNNCVIVLSQIKNN